MKLPKYDLGYNTKDLLKSWTKIVFWLHYWRKDRSPLNFDLQDVRYSFWLGYTKDESSFDKMECFRAVKGVNNKTCEPSYP